MVLQLQDRVAWHYSPVPCHPSRCQRLTTITPASHHTLAISAPANGCGEPQPASAGGGKPQPTTT